jgi:hypothetical protein
LRCRGQLVFCGVRYGETEWVSRDHTHPQRAGFGLCRA